MHDWISTNGPMEFSSQEDRNLAEELTWSLCNLHVVR